MAFNIDRFTRTTLAFNSGAITLADSSVANGPALFTYATADDTAAEVAAANYFGGASAAYDLAVGDIIMGNASDASFALKIATIDRAAGTATTVSMSLTGAADTANIVDSAITTAKIADDAVTSAKVDEGLIQTVTVTVSTGELLALATTPKELVAAPGADKVVQFLGAQLVLNYAGVAYTESGDNMAIKYENASGVAVSDTIECTGFIDATADTLTNAVPVKDAIVAASGCVNKALVLDNIGSNFAAGTSPVDVVVAYKVVTAGL